MTESKSVIGAHLLLDEVLEEGRGDGHAAALDGRFLGGPEVLGVGREQEGGAGCSLPTCTGALPACT